MLAVQEAVVQVEEVQVHQLFMASGAHGNPGAGAAALVVEAHRARLGGVTVLLLVEEAQTAVGGTPGPRAATPKHVQLFMATGAHGNPGASAAGLVVEAHRARLGPATILLLE